METLQLKHICGYLPYGLPARLSRQGIFNLDLEYPDENVYRVGFIDNFSFFNGELSGSIEISEKLSYDFEEGDFEILLRPLYSLTKEIEHNGERFVPMERLRENIAPNWFAFSKHWIEDDEDLTNTIVEYSIIKKLQEWHFDYQNLLSNKLAINLEEI